MSSTLLRRLRRKSHKVALVLAGGAARAIAHIGVLKVLQREKIPFDLIVGSSMGSIIGAAYSLDRNLQKTEKMALHTSFRDIMDVTFPKLAINRGKKLRQMVDKVVGGRSFKDLNIPLAVVATDIGNGKTIIYQSGDLAQAITASCSIPIIYKPVKVGNRLIVDGGIKNTVPVAIAKELGATFIIASNVGFCVRNFTPSNIFQVLMQFYQIEGQALSDYQMMGADIAINSELGEIDQMAFDKAKECIKRGEEAAERTLGRLKKRTLQKLKKKILRRSKSKLN